MMKKQRVSLILGLACLSLALAIAVFLNVPTCHEQVFTFDSTYNSNSVVLEASYWASNDAQYAVLICPGYSCDRQKWRPMANVLASHNLAVMSFDYSGQGASQGVIGFDNAKTDAIPVEIDDAIDQLTALTGLDRSHIILLGHSMGGRSILRLMNDWHAPDADTSISSSPVGNVILISPEVNYHFNAQASLFAGTSDDAEEPWHSYSAANTAGTNVFLYGSTADDIVSADDILAIYRHLGGQDVPSSGTWTATQTNEAGSTITVGITDGVLHSYQMYSPRFAQFVNEALSVILPDAASSNYPPQHMSLIYVLWALSLLGLFLTLHALTRGPKQIHDEIPVLVDAGQFLRRKALMWLPGTLVAFVICCLCVCMPFGSPVMNIPYMCFIAGYGIVMLFAYRKGSFKGTRGKLPRLFLHTDVKGRNLLVTCLVTIGLCAFVWYVLRTTMYRLIPLNFRLFWVNTAAVLMAIGYYVSGCENDMMDKAGVQLSTRLWYNAITYVPLFLLVGFYLVIKSYSGMIGQVQNMILMYIFCIPLGDYIRQQTGSRATGAVVSAFLFQTLMITSAALISMF